MDHWTQELFVENAGLYMSELQALEEHGDGEADRLLELLNRESKRPASILDVGCGIGRHARAFADRGIPTTGIDISPAFLSEAQDRARNEGVADLTEFRELDVRSLDEMAETFDLAVCLYNTIGYFDDTENVAVLRKIRERLADGGVCAVQVGNKDAVLTDLPDSVVHETSGGMVVEQYEYDTRSSRLTKARNIFRGKQGDLDHMGRTEYEVRLYSPPELERALQDAGFDSISLYDGFDGAPVGFDAERIVALAQ